MTQRITSGDLDVCVDLCRRHLQALQTERGNFRYQYDWEKGEYLDDDNAVRQAGSLWALADLRRLRPDPALDEACARGLAFYDEHSGTNGEGGRFATYPDQEHGYMGSTALLALTLIELLRNPAAAGAAEQDRWRDLLDGYLHYLLDAQLADGRWPSLYDAATGRAHGEPSAFFDGESLLALTRAARHLGIPHLGGAITRGAAGAYRRHVLLALRRDHNSSDTVGYYQWGTMAMYEIIKMDMDESDRYEEIVHYLADWLCRIRRLGDRSHNPAASLEGLLHAYDLAASGDFPARAERYRETIEASLQRMLGLQVGHPRACGLVSRAPPEAPSLGGCQHWPERPELRIDFAMHQLHAALLAAQLFLRA